MYTLVYGRYCIIIYFRLERLKTKKKIIKKTLNKQLNNRRVYIIL